MGRTTIERKRGFMPLMREPCFCAGDVSLSPDALVNGLISGVPLMRARSPCTEDLPRSTDGLVNGLFTGVPFQSMFVTTQVFRLKPPGTG